MRKEAGAHAIELYPVVRLHYVLGGGNRICTNPSGDLRRLFDALEAEWGLKGPGPAICRPCKRFSPRCAPAAWQVTVAVHVAKSKSSRCGRACKNPACLWVWRSMSDPRTIAVNLRADLQSGEVVAFNAGMTNRKSASARI